MKSIAYDITRLLARCNIPTPNGIDRIDLAYARYFLDQTGEINSGAVLYGLEPSLLYPRIASPFLEEIATHWRAGKRSEISTISAKIKGLDFCSPPKSTSRSLSWSRALALSRANHFAKIPYGAAFVHTTHFPLSPLFSWLKNRRDVRPIFFVHDLLPSYYPEYFLDSHVREHTSFLELVLQRASAVITNTCVVAQQIEQLAHAHRKRKLAIFAKHIPSDEVFWTTTPDSSLSATPYFVMVGTIEPRKNHLLILHIWRALAKEFGKRTPKLLIIGSRGWKNENVLDFLDRSDQIREHVFEFSGLSTEDVAKLVASARALLIPSFDEGYGLPLVEAQQLGTPVIAADNLVFRELSNSSLLLDPLDGVAWKNAIVNRSDRQFQSSLVKTKSYTEAWKSYFSDIENFIDAAPPAQ